jgi:hypothetical protein
MFGEVVDLPKIEIVGEDDAPFALGQGDNFPIAQPPRALATQAVTWIAQCF